MMKISDGERKEISDLLDTLEGLFNDVKSGLDTIQSDLGTTAQSDLDTIRSDLKEMSTDLSVMALRKRIIISSRGGVDFESAGTVKMTCGLLREIAGGAFSEEELMASGYSNDTVARIISTASKFVARDMRVV
ncbi:MAG: hypothetical protein AAGB32_01900 [Pseudomonadota bacterium]